MFENNSLTRTRYPQDARPSQRESRYRVHDGARHYAGEIGEMSGRFVDPSYNDIELRFADGERRWFHFSEVERVHEGEA